MPPALCKIPQPSAGGPRAGSGGSCRGKTICCCTCTTHTRASHEDGKNDPEAFLDLFERTAEACGGAQEHWPECLIPLLIGKAQMVA